MHRTGPAAHAASTDTSQPEQRMRKLTLKIDSLKVDSFQTGDENRLKGTVQGHDTIETEWCTGYGHPGCNISRQCQTPYDTCYGTCGCSKGCGGGETATCA